RRVITKNATKNEITEFFGNFRRKRFLSLRINNAGIIEKKLFNAYGLNPAKLFQHGTFDISK
ncbi:MAG: hypothetical protein NTW67_03725, partial [Candidatus Woesearchaeota archaeon]|nr:hypothetical protein [Candidatus Woesearchaeota archaeon]